MKIGIDSYCYHRFFGEVYAQQVPPPTRTTLEDFVDAIETTPRRGCFARSLLFPGILRGIPRGRQEPPG